MTPLISIIIPVYNSEKYIQGTIYSCINQSYANLEIIIVNDGSTDSSEKIIKKFDDTRIKYYKTPNKGPCHARNFGIKKATGELFQFLDADDILENKKLEVQVGFYRSKGEEYVYSGIMGFIIKGQKKFEKGFNFYYKNLGVQEYFRAMFGNYGKYYTTGMWLIPRKLVEKTHGWDEKVLINNDGEYFSRIILHSKGIIYCPGAIFYYRRDVPMSVSKRFNSRKIYVSWLYSYTCYVKYFQLNFDKKSAEELGREALSVYYCNSYPNYPDLLQECKQQIRLLGYNSPVAYGGKIFKLTSALIGTENALKIRVLRNQKKYFFNIFSN